jgi:hypothetical protein
MLVTRTPKVMLAADLGFEMRSSLLAARPLAAGQEIETTNQIANSVEPRWENGICPVWHTHGRQKTPLFSRSLWHACTCH